MSALINKSYLLVIVLLVGCTGNHVKNLPGEQKEDNGLFGTWKVKKYIFGNSPIAFENEQQAARYIDKKIILTANKAEIFDDYCLKPSYEITRKYTKDLFYNEFNETDSTIIPSMDSVTLNIVSCLTAPLSENPDSLNFVYYLVYLNNKEMIAHVNGAYLFLNKE